MQISICRAIQKDPLSRILEKRMPTIPLGKTLETSNIRKVLIVAYSFPPVGGAGVQRTTKFVKYLRWFGWEPIVLTVYNPSVPHLDQDLSQDIPMNCEIYRARTLEPSYDLKMGISGLKKDSHSAIKTFKSLLKMAQSYFLLPDAQILWWPFMMKSLMKILRRRKIDCIFVTAPPFSTLFPVCLIGKRLGVPVVVDFRDDWSFSRLNMENAASTRYAKYVDRVLEKYVLFNCSAFTAATQSYVNSLVSRYPKVDVRKGHVITNGFDRDDFLFKKKQKIKESSSTKDFRINFLYAGTVWKATSLKPFIEAMKILLKGSVTLRDKICVKIIGRVVEQELAYMEVPELEGVLEIKGYQPHTKVLEQMDWADVLLLTLSDLPGAEQIIPGKIFEYMAIGKHIVAIVPKGETRQILRQHYSNATVLYPNEIDRVASCISGFVKGAKNGMVSAVPDVSQYERKLLTRKLSEVLFSCAGSRGISDIRNVLKA